MTEIVYWADGSWCHLNELQEFAHKSDDFIKVKVPEFWDDGMIDDWVATKTNS